MPEVAPTTVTMLQQIQAAAAAAAAAAGFVSQQGHPRTGGEWLGGAIAGDSSGAPDVR
jgi:hypothetical protein